MPSKIIQDDRNDAARTIEGILRNMVGKSYLYSNVSNTRDRNFKIDESWNLYGNFEFRLPRRVGPWITLYIRVNDEWRLDEPQKEEWPEFSEMSYSVEVEVSMSSGSMDTNEDTANFLGLLSEVTKVANAIRDEFDGVILKVVRQHDTPDPSLVEIEADEAFRTSEQLYLVGRAELEEREEGKYGKTNKRFNMLNPARVEKVNRRRIVVIDEVDGLRYQFDRNEPMKIFVKRG